MNQWIAWLVLILGILWILPMFGVASAIIDWLMPIIVIVVGIMLLMKKK